MSKLEKAAKGAIKKAAKSKGGGKKGKGSGASVEKAAKKLLK